jgi:hypothetical protein
MATIDKPRTRTPYVPPITPEELQRRNAEAIRLLESWAADDDIDDQRETLAILRQALGPDRIMSNRNVFKP